MLPLDVLKDSARCLDFAGCLEIQGIVENECPWKEDPTVKLLSQGHGNGAVYSGEIRDGTAWNSKVFDVS